MRHLLAALVGLLLAIAAAVAAGQGVGLTFRPVHAQSLESADRGSGLVWLLVAGVFLGMLVLSRRLSPVAPLVAGGLLLVATLLELAAPRLLVPGAESPSNAAFGMYVLNGYGLGALFAALLLVVAAIPAGRRSARPH